MTTASTGMQLLLGRLHPLLVHLPIGGLVLLGTVELLSRSERWKNAAQNSLLIIFFVCASALGAAASGWTLARSGGYDQPLLKWHQTAGLILVGLCITAAVLRKLELTRAYHVCLALAIPVLIITGHLGGSMTYGRDFLTPKLAWAFRNKPPLAQPVFAAVVEPILQRRCVVCHGPDKHKAGLRLDTFEALRRGGQDGPVLKAGKAEESSLLQRILLPLDHDGHMPPEDEPQPTAQEIAVLEWWINAGAEPNATVSELKPAPSLQGLLQWAPSPAN